LTAEGDVEVTHPVPAPERADFRDAKTRFLFFLTILNCTKNSSAEHLRPNHSLAQCAMLECRVPEIYVRNYLDTGSVIIARTLTFANSTNKIDIIRRSNILSTGLPKSVAVVSRLTDGDKQRSTIQKHVGNEDSISSSPGREHVKEHALSLITEKGRSVIPQGQNRLDDMIENRSQSSVPPFDDAHAFEAPFQRRSKRRKMGAREFNQLTMISTQSGSAVTALEQSFRLPKFTNVGDPIEDFESGNSYWTSAMFPSSRVPQPQIKYPKALKSNRMKQYVKYDKPNIFGRSRAGRQTFACCDGFSDSELCPQMSSQLKRPRRKRPPAKIKSDINENIFGSLELVGGNRFSMSLCLEVVKSPRVN
jgi:hypothetical protein